MNKPPAWGLSFAGFSARTGMMVFTALLAHSGSCRTKFGGYQPRSAVAGRALLASVTSGTSAQVNWERLPLPSVNFDEVLPESQMMMEFFGRVTGSPRGSQMLWFQKAIHIKTDRVSSAGHRMEHTLLKPGLWYAELPAAQRRCCLHPGPCIFFILRSSQHCWLAYVTDSFLCPGTFFFSYKYFQ